MSNPNHEPVDGYTLLSNYFFQGDGHVKAHTPESVLESILETGVPIEAVHIRINPILGGFSGYLRNDYRHVCMALDTQVRTMLEALRMSLPKDRAGLKWYDGA